MEQIEKIVRVLELENDKLAASDPNVKKAMRIVETFLKENDVMCYGGTAVNAVLPPEDQFYNPEYDIPDYDFFSQTPQEHAMKLADQLYKAGIVSVEVKPAIHLGTFKVFADYEGVADITHLEVNVFEKLWKERETKRGIHYVPIDFLRMSMYLELSRPKGDVSRWVKIYKRLMLLNKHHPIICKNMPNPFDPVSEEHKQKVKTLLEKEPVVLLGITASQFHLKAKDAWSYPISILADASTIEGFVKKEIKYEKHEAVEILPAHTDFKDDNDNVWLRAYETTACHSYHKMKNGMYVASIPTLLHFYFANLYTEHPEDEIDRILCTAQRILDLKQQTRRFETFTPVECIGTQATLIDLREERSELYERLHSKKSSAEFLRYFFNYSPTTMSKTEKQKLKQSLRKTKKVRYASS